MKKKRQTGKLSNLFLLRQITVLVLICLSVIALSGCWPLLIGPGVKAVGTVAAQYTTEMRETYTLSINADVPLTEKVIYKALEKRGFTVLERRVNEEEKTKTEIVSFKVEKNGIVQISIQPENAQKTEIAVFTEDDNFDSAADAQSLWFGILSSACNHGLQVSCH
jgi:hypothetical protein